MKMQSRAFIIIIVIVISMAVAVTVAVVILCQMQTRTNSSAPIRAWLNNTVDRAGMNSSALSQCDNAPFVLPSSGFVGLLYGDTAGPYNILRRHTGIDIFGDGVPGTIPVYAAYNGWLSRHSNWISTVAIRHDDPLADRVIYTYYTHMASRDGQTSFILRQFAPGISEVPVRQGDLIGYQGRIFRSGPACGDAPALQHCSG